MMKWASLLGLVAVLAVVGATDVQELAEMEAVHQSLPANVDGVDIAALRAAIRQSVSREISKHKAKKAVAKKVVAEKTAAAGTKTPAEAADEKHLLTPEGKNQLRKAIRKATKVALKKREQEATKKAAKVSVAQLVKKDMKNSKTAAELVKLASKAAKKSGVLRKTARAIARGQISPQAASVTGKIKMQISNGMEKATAAVADKVAGKVTNTAQREKIKAAFKIEMGKAVDAAAHKVAHDVQVTMHAHMKGQGLLAKKATDKAITKQALKAKALSNEKAKLLKAMKGMTGDALKAVKAKIAKINERERVAAEAAKEMRKAQKMGQNTASKGERSIIKTAAKVKVMQKEAGVASKIANEKVQKGKTAEVKAKKLAQKSKETAKKNAQKVKEMARKRVRKANQEAAAVKRAATRMKRKAAANAALTVAKANAAIRARSVAVAGAVKQATAAPPTIIAGMKEDARSAQRQLKRAKRNNRNLKKQIEKLRAEKANAASKDEVNALKKQMKAMKKAFRASQKKMERKAEKAAEKARELAKATASRLRLPAKDKPVVGSKGQAVMIVNGMHVPTPGKAMVTNSKDRTVHIHIHPPKSGKGNDKVKVTGKKGSKKGGK